MQTRKKQITEHDAYLPTDEKFQASQNLFPQLTRMLKGLEVVHGCWVDSDEAVGGHRLSKRKSVL